MVPRERLELPTCGLGNRRSAEVRGRAAAVFRRQSRTEIGERLLPPLGPRRIFSLAILFVVSASMVFTNIMLWAFVTRITRPDDRFSIRRIWTIIRRGFVRTRIKFNSAGLTGV